MLFPTLNRQQSTRKFDLYVSVDLALQHSKQVAQWISLSQQPA